MLVKPLITRQRDIAITNANAQLAELISYNHRFDCFFDCMKSFLNKEGIKIYFSNMNDNNGILEFESDKGNISFDYHIDEKDFYLKIINIDFFSGSQYLLTQVYFLKLKKIFKILKNLFKSNITLELDLDGNDEYKKIFDKAGFQDGIVKI